jgi:hypothetical protein
MKPTKIEHQKNQKRVALGEKIINQWLEILKYFIDTYINFHKYTFSFQYYMSFYIYYLLIFYDLEPQVQKSQYYIKYFSYFWGFGVLGI